MEIRSKFTTGTLRTPGFFTSEPGKGQSSCSFFVNWAQKIKKEVNGVYELLIFFSKYNILKQYA